MTPLECEIIVGSIPAGAISRKGGSIWGMSVNSLTYDRTKWSACGSAYPNSVRYFDHLGNSLSDGDEYLDSNNDCGPQADCDARLRSDSYADGNAHTLPCARSRTDADQCPYSHSNWHAYANVYTYAGADLYRSAYTHPDSCTYADNAPYPDNCTSGHRYP